MGNRIFLSTVCAAASCLLYTTFFFKKNLIAASSSPEAVPRLVLGCILAVSALLLLRESRRGPSGRRVGLLEGARPHVLAALTVYLLILPWLGFTVSTFLLLSVLFTILAKGRPTPKSVLLNALLAAVLAGVTFFVFRQVFHIQLPVNMFDI